MMIRARCDQIPVHGPVVVLAEGEAVGRVVVLALGKRDEVGGVDETDVVAGGELDAESAGGALVVVDGEDLAAEGGRAAVFEGLVCDLEIGLTIDDLRLLIFDWKRIGEIAGDEGLAHELAVGGDGDEVLETIGEAGEDLADVGDADFPADRRAVAFKGLPETVACQIAEGQIGVVLVVVFLDEQEAGSEAVAELLAPRNPLGSGEALVDEIEGGEQEERLVGLLVGRAFGKRRDADVEVVETFDGGGEEHGWRKVEN